MLTRRNFLRLMGASAALATTGAEFLTKSVASAAALFPIGSNGINHVVVLMMENRSFDHFLSWLPGADGRNDLTFVSADGNTYPNYPLAPDFQGCGYSDPDHSWEGWLVQSNGGLNNGFLLGPTAPTGLAGVTLAASNTFPVGYYTNLNPDGSPKTSPDLPVIGALAQNYTVLDRYFASFAGEPYPNRMYQHAAQTDRDHNDATSPSSFLVSTLPTIWDQLSPAATTGVPTGGYFFRDLPFLGLWEFKYAPFWRPVYDSDLPVIAATSVTSLPDSRSWMRRRRGTSRMSALSTRPSTRKATAPPPTTIPWPTYDSGSGSSPTSTTPSATMAISTTPCSSSPSTSGAGSMTTFRLRTSPMPPTPPTSAIRGTAPRQRTAS
jgi:hypothetical protein